MRRVLSTVSFLCGVVALTACAGQSSRVAAPDVNDPAWTPPGEMSLMVHNAPEPAAANNTAAMACPQPNKTEIRSHQIHAAMYQ